MKKIISLILISLLCLSLTACSSKEEETVKGTYNAGTYTGTAVGHGGDFKVDVTLSADKIESITVVENNETSGFGDVAAVKIIGQIIANQSL